MKISEKPSPCPIGRLYSPMLESAIRLAARGHYHQFRKRNRDAIICDGEVGKLANDCIPYVTHLMGTTLILARLGCRDTVLAAAFLHDYLEDVPDVDGCESIREATSDEVVHLVRAVTENKRRDQAESLTWETRKREQVANIDHMAVDAVLIKAADLYHNLQSLVVDLEQASEPSQIWRRLHADPERQLWYFTSVVAATRRRLGDHPLTRDLSAILGMLLEFLPTTAYTPAD